MGSRKGQILPIKRTLPWTESLHKEVGDDFGQVMGNFYFRQYPSFGYSVLYSVRHFDELMGPKVLPFPSPIFLVESTVLQTRTWCIYL